MTQKLYLFAILIVGVLTGCSEDPTTATYPAPVDYQPLKIGSWYIYDVDSISYNDFTTPVTIDSITYQIREQYTDTFTDLAGNLNYRVEREKRYKNDTLPYDSSAWVHSDVWFITLKDQNIERVEENIRYVSLMNPVKNEYTWDGNGFNFYETWDYEYQQVGEAFEEFPNTLTVNQIIEDQFVIIYQLYEEVYAKDVGLVNRIRIDVESQNLSNPAIPVIDRAEKGFQFFQRLNSYYIPE